VSAIAVIQFHANVNIAGTYMKQSAAQQFAGK